MLEGAARWMREDPRLVSNEGGSVPKEVSELGRNPNPGEVLDTCADSDEGEFSNAGEDLNLGEVPGREESSKMHIFLNGR